MADRRASRSWAYLGSPATPGLPYAEKKSRFTTSSFSTPIGLRIEFNRAYDYFAQPLLPGQEIANERESKYYFCHMDIVAVLAVGALCAGFVTGLAGFGTGLVGLVIVVVSREVGAGAVLSGRFRQGVVDNAGDPDRLETGILTLLDQAADPELREAARRLGEQYSWGSHFCRLEALLNEVVHEPGARHVS